MNPLLLLHGAIGAALQLKPLKEALSTEFDVYSLDFSGHGGKELPVVLNFDLFAQDILDWMKDHNFEQIDILGYSMGGYAALYLAKHHPEKIGKIFTIATKFEWSEEIAQKEIKMLNPEKIQEKLPQFAQILEQRHAPQDWKQVLNITASMMLDMGKNNPLTTEDFTSILHPVLLSVGDRDTMVTLAETVQTQKLLQNSQLLVMPNTQHPIEKISLERIVWEAKNWFGK